MFLGDECGSSWIWGCFVWVCFVKVFEISGRLFSRVPRMRFRGGYFGVLCREIWGRGYMVTGFER